MTSAPSSVQPPDAVVALAQQRAQARAAKDWAASDALRDEIAALGWLVKDGPDGFSLSERPPFEVVSSIRELPSGLAAHARCAVVVLVDGWPQDAATCLDALVAHAPADVVIVAVDLGDVDGAGRVVHERATAHPDRVIEVHLATPLAQSGWGPTVTAMLAACATPLVGVMDMSTILDGDALGPILAAFDDPSVVASGWRGVDVNVDDAWRSFVDAGAGEVDAVLGYLIVVRREAALAAPPHAKAKFYRNADMEWSLAMRAAGGRLVIPEGALPLHQDRHHGYHDSDPEYRDRESRKTYDRLLQAFRGRTDILRPRA